MVRINDISTTSITAAKKGVPYPVGTPIPTKD